MCKASAESAILKLDVSIAAVCRSNLSRAFSAAVISDYENPRAMPQATAEIAPLALHSRPP